MWRHGSSLGRFMDSTKLRLGCVGDARSTQQIGGHSGSYLIWCHIVGSQLGVTSIADVKEDRSAEALLLQNSLPFKKKRVGGSQTLISYMLHITN
jgi:hypothetical protein